MGSVVPTHPDFPFCVPYKSIDAINEEGDSFLCGGVLDAMFDTEKVEFV